MFRITIRDIGVKRTTKQINGYVDTMGEAKTLGLSECSSILGHNCFDIFKIATGIFVITHNNLFLGSIKIRRL